MHGYAMELDSPRFQEGRRFLIAGLSERYRCAALAAAIPVQWQRFARYLGGIAGQVGKVAYGNGCSTDEADSMDYLCGVEVADFSSVPRNFGRLCVTAQSYAVFAHRGHIGSIGDSWGAVWSTWLPGCGHEAVDGLSFERYGESFDPRTGTGGAELWVPIAGTSLRRGGPVTAGSAQP